MSSRTLVALFALVAFVAFPLVAHAQPSPEEWQRLLRQQRGQGQPNLPRENLNASGVLKAARGSVIQLQTEDGELWYIQVQLTRPTDVTFSGPAEASFVKPGMLVQFSSKLSRRNQAPEPIQQLTVFTLKEGYQLGVFGDSALSGGSSAGGFFDAPTEEPKKKKVVVKDNEDTEYRIAGQITKISRTGEMTINAGGTTVKADLAEDARVSIDVSDLSYARPGDKVEVRGWYYQGQKGQAVGTLVSVSTAEPLTGPKKKTPAKAAAAQADKADEAEDGAKADDAKKLFE